MRCRKWKRAEEEKLLIGLIANVLGIQALCSDCAWHKAALCSDCAWHKAALCSDCAWHKAALCSECAWHKAALCSDCAWHKTVLCSDCAWHNTALGPPWSYNMNHRLLNVNVDLIFNWMFKQFHASTAQGFGQHTHTLGGSLCAVDCSLVCL